MFLYSFQWRYGHDKICRTEQKDLSIGDLYVGGADMYLALGDTVSRKVPKEKYTILETISLHHAWFFSKKAIELLHRMSHEYYSSYKNIVKLFVPGELADLFHREIKTKKKQPQKLLVYPDVRTMANLAQQSEIELSDKGIAILNGTSTQLQKDKARWGIKMGHIHTLLGTPSQVFQDWKDLDQITLIDSHQRYYKSQQDPRYDVREICKKLSDLHNAKLETTGVEILKQFDWKAE